MTSSCSVWRGRIALLLASMVGTIPGRLAPRALRGEDCNRNGVTDLEDLARGTSMDCDGDGVPSVRRPSALTSAASRQGGSSPPRKRNWWRKIPSEIETAEAGSRGSMGFAPSAVGNRNDATSLSR